MKRSYVLAMSVALSLIVTGCSDSEPKSDRDTGSDAEIDGGQSVSELCLDEEYEHYDEERRKEALHAIFYKIHGPGAEPHPHCMREDGLGGDDEYCEDSEVDPVHYFFCVETDAESEEGEGEGIEGRSEPCYWWIRPIMASEMCYYEVVCAPEGRLDEFGWPEGAGFEYQEENYDFDICNPVDWLED